MRYCPLFLSSPRGVGAAGLRVPPLPRAETRRAEISLPRCQVRAKARWDASPRVVVPNAAGTQGVMQ